MRLLALDCATRACSVAVWRAGGCEARRFQPSERGQAELLMPMVMDVMRMASVGFGDLDGLAVTVGPGSFTGLRIGLAAARGMAMASGLPLVGVTTFEAFVQAVPEARSAGRPLIAVIDTKRSDLYVQRFAPDRSPCNDAAALLPETLAALLADTDCLVVGDAVDRVRAAMGRGGAGLEYLSVRALDAADVAALAAGRLAATPSGVLPGPFYLHAPAVRLPADDPSRT